MAIGFRFKPTDEELVGVFLYQKVMGFELPWDGIIKRDVYGNGAELWNVFSDGDNWHTKKESGTTKKTIYVFTKVTKAVSKSKWNSRKAGCGMWSAQTGLKNIEPSDTGKIIGCTRMLSFQCPKANKVLWNWIMHEYSLTDAGLTATRQTNTDSVLCKITKCIKKASQPATMQFHIPAMTGKRGGGETE